MTDSGIRTRSRATAGERSDALRLVFAGDFCPIDRPGGLICAGRSIDLFGDLLPELLDSDLSVVNLECPLSRRGSPIPKNGPNLVADPRAVEALAVARFRVACMANNHVADYGSAGVIDTMNLLKRRHIRYAGVGENLNRAMRPLFLNVKGRKVAFLAFAENEFGCADDRQAGACPFDPVRNIGQIREAAGKSDICIAMVHGGNEYNPVPNPMTVRACRAFAEAGAALVIGTHPHVPQGWEIHRGAPILYSLGNFVFDGPSEYPMWSYGLVARITFHGARAKRTEIIPFKADPDTSCLALLRGRARTTFMAYLRCLSGIVKSDTETERYWRAWCAMMGPAWAERVRMPLIPWRNATERDRFMRTRNFIACQAHHHLLVTYLDLARNRRVKEAAGYIRRIRTLQQGGLP